MEKGGSYFESELDFCPECGTVLPLPGIQDKVICPCCSFNIDVREFEKRVIHTSVTFNKIDSSSLSAEEGKEVKGPLIDRKCPRCGHEGMAYHTRQMRSADEGQTVFYTCIQCFKRKKILNRVCQNTWETVLKTPLVTENHFWIFMNRLYRS